MVTAMLACYLLLDDFRLGDQLPGIRRWSADFRRYLANGTNARTTASEFRIA
jgi:hypothetical protein